MKWLSIGTKRGLSGPVNAAILVSAVAVMGVFVVGWSQSNLLQHQAALENTFSDKMNRMHEQVTFENVWFGGTGPSKFVNVTVANVGTVGLNVTQIEFVNATTTTFTITDGGLVPSNTYSLEEQYTWTSGTAINVIVTTGRGNIYTTQVLPP